MNELERKIQNRDTELHRAYDDAQHNIAYLKNKIKEHEQLIETNKMAIYIWQEQIEACKQRAASQGFPGLFD